MPWKETGPVDERIRFIGDWTRGVFAMSELCERYGISRKTGYKWVGRYAADGVEGLRERSRAPGRVPHRTAAEVVAAIVAERERHRTWGPRKILQRLARTQPTLVLPAVSTAGEALRRAGLVTPRRRRRRWPHPGRARTVPMAPNQVWTADFKGEFRTGNGRYCYPLTIADEYSRYLVACRALPSVASRGACAVFGRVFQDVGLPEVIRTDNGGPFVSPKAIRGLSRLNIWWLKLGILHERIDPGKPQQNPCHERMHRTLKAETCRPPAANAQAQQRRFDAFRAEYNHERPHEALDLQTPAEHWHPSPRPYPRRVPGPCYPGHMLVRLVADNGSIRLHSRALFISQALAGEYIALEEVDDGLWSIYFYHLLLARLDQRTFTLHA